MKIYIIRNSSYKHLLTLTIINKKEKKNTNCAILTDISLHAKHCNISMITL